MESTLSMDGISMEALARILPAIIRQEESVRDEDEYYRRRKCLQRVSRVAKMMQKRRVCIE